MISKDAVSDLYESLMQKDHTGKCLADSVSEYDRTCSILRC